MLSMKDSFIKIKEVPTKVGQEVKIRGWIYRERKTKNYAFIVVRDSSGIVQCVLDKSSFSQEKWEEIKKDADVEASVLVKGNVIKQEKAPTGFEIQVSEIKIVGKSPMFPITKDLSRDFIDDVRHLWIRSRKMTSVLKVRSTVFQAIREYFLSEGFYETQSPIIQATQCEGGSTLFEVKYFDKKMYLAQTWQLHAEAVIFALEKIFCIAPSFRAERSKTSRHLAEYWHAEMEAAWEDFEDLQNRAEALVKHVVKRVLEKNKEDLEVLGRDISKLKPVIEKPFVRMTYDDALKILKDKFNFEVPWGKDLRTIEEEKLVSLYDVPIIVTHYPKEIKAFYMKEDPKNPKVVLGFDLLAPEGNGELIGASERETDLEKLKQRLIEQGEDPDQYGFYLDTRKYGSVPHSGFGMGVERIVKWLCGLDHIKDAIAFPRTMVRYYP
ncbi:MAG: asparaginyl-tRNA synthetase [Candidatus Woesearchaeota archaeon]|nr:asparaginyl-tRNA synthetase [Candidatus Woesearchaeota archaeon]MDN5328194.1 asparaginyl-tRNA synthetase [Candidatus Woesearchaeota archaeon]